MIALGPKSAVTLRLQVLFFIRLYMNFDQLPSRLAGQAYRIVFVIEPALTKLFLTCITVTHSDTLGLNLSLDNQTFF